MDPMMITLDGSVALAPRVSAGKSSRVRRNTPSTFNAYVLSHPRSSCVSNSAPHDVPELCTNTCTRSSPFASIALAHFFAPSSADKSTASSTTTPSLDLHPSRALLDALYTRFAP